MNKSIIRFTLWLSVSLSTIAVAKTTHRTPQFDNDKVIVWKTIIYPSRHQQLQLHRHEHNRVLVAFDNGTLKITDQNGATHYLHLVAQQAYYLTKDAGGSLHTDENMTQHPIRVMVIELKK